MRPGLLIPDGGIDRSARPPVHVDEITDDLELPTLLEVMSGGDDLIRDACEHVLLQCCVDVDVVRHRQEVFRDCAAHEDAILELYALATETLRQEHDVFRSVFTRRAESMLRHAVQVFKIYATSLRSLRDTCRTLEPQVESPGLRRMCAMIRENLDDAYLEVLNDHIRRLQLKDGMLVSGELRNDGQTGGLIMRTIRPENRTMFHRNGIKRPNHSYTIPERDENGFRSLGEFRDRGLAAAAGAAESSAEAVRTFFQDLRFELGYYLGGLNLVEALQRLDVPTCIPTPGRPDSGLFAVEGLHEPALAIQSGAKPTPSDLKAGDVGIIVITGANRGGKSTMLRAIGLAHLMMQGGLPVAAESFTGALRPSIFTHFKREEDESLTSGKFDEELKRMKAIVHDIRPHCLLLCNESFSATNEAEGSQIGFDTVSGLIDSGVTVVLVTHMYDLSHAFVDDERPAVFLRAERGEEGHRTFQIVEAPPLPTSYGGDVYARVFGTRPDESPASASAGHDG